MDEKKILCGAAAASEKYYFNPRYANLPETVQEELKMICVLFAEEVGGTFLIAFDENGEPVLQTVRDEEDILFDEIEAELQIRRLQKEHEDLFQNLAVYYQTFFGQDEA